ncbi:MAG: LacI family DNA-binding transcriptional regulator [Anaerolineae bacterium]|jgi:DNA-binding LacI/PurR family transcriptional regulator|nr:LacI family DNA-binding transcriptional regulator [Anaerolineae bacterium]MBT7190451.1 LacI family DNA-binding transcriptional regulator [Anaerolineae bacterium]MBT7989282.1 LacI family DNA-binding transcriptional regulator [Anaerolineae bacterium]
MTSKKTSPSSRKPTKSGSSQIDVARLAGVSQAAVSRTFTPDASVSDETRAKVMAAVDQLGYRPNVIARSLVQNSTNIIGLVVRRFTAPFYAYIIQNFIKALQERGYWALIFNIGQSDELAEALPAALQYQVDGLIITSATLSSHQADECARAGTPVVLFNRYVSDGHTHLVSCDHCEGGRMAADALLNTGHTRLAYIAGEEESSTNRDREIGFVSRLKEQGYDLAFRESAGDYNYEKGYAAAQRLLEREPRPDAVFCADDVIAMATMDLARYKLGLRIPEDLSVIGFDDIPPSARPNYQLTTIRQPFGRLVDSTIDALLEAINSPDTKVIEKVVPPTLTWRKTVQKNN